ncbi:c-type cytochrome [uncultured Thiohalocapsa sp.]|uniref:c-type cytochrome n=1 Tax=uncultured Thiohalocapsa sp. TaxID=768990 RepID=UPI0025FC3E91|nr:c-type cytochrome [uncultured Thiohalocapsa sp.]
MDRYSSAPSHSARRSRLRPATRRRLWRLPFPAALSLLISSAIPLAAGADESAEVTGAQVYAYCVDCHGKRGEGGANGTYPRIAGLPQPYVDRQLHAFKSQTRVNKPMVPIFKHHRFDAEVIDLVAGHVADFTPPRLSLWPYEPTPEALAAFDDKAAFAAAGADLYAEACASCHGADAGGDETGKVPPLIIQYPAYLKKQIGDFARDERKLPADGRCGELDPAQAEAVISHIVEVGK